MDALGNLPHPPLHAALGGSLCRLCLGAALHQLRHTPDAITDTPTVDRLVVKCNTTSFTERSDPGDVDERAQESAVNTTCVKAVTHGGQTCQLKGTFSFIMESWLILSPLASGTSSMPINLALYLTPSP